MAGWALDLLLKNDLKTAFYSLKKIRGIGSKIAPFYLRDIFILSQNHNLPNLDDKFLLHPIDVWTRRAGKILLNNQDDATDKQCADALIQLEQELSLIYGYSNIAFWVFGALIAEDNDMFGKAVQAIARRNEQELKDVVDVIVDSEKDWLRVLERLI